jgi:hypothetical protein
VTPAFLTPLRTEKIGAQRWLLIDDLIFRSVALRGLVVAPHGFQTDLASIPRFAWTVFPKEDLYDAGAVIHDAAYGNALMTMTGDRMFVVKPIADNLFHEAILALGVPAWRANLMYWAVQQFGNPLGHPLAQNDAVRSRV